MKWFARLFRNNKADNPKEIKNVKTMQNIKEAIMNHLLMKTNGALLLTGEWGSGKTYYIKETLFPEIEQQGQCIPIIISLYGESDKVNIAQKVLFAYFDKAGNEVKLSTGAVVKNLKYLTDAIPVIKKYVDIEKLINGAGENIFRFLPHEKLLICFDDIERISDKLDVNDFLGIINDLVENKGCKVLLIANESKIKNGITFKEKTIEKTILFQPEISAVYDNIIASYNDELFLDYLKQNKSLILQTLQSNREDKTENQELNKYFSNIRTIKFAIEHFKLIFSIVTNGKNINDEVLQKQLKNIWIFTLAISVEFRKPNNISFNERKGIESLSNTTNDEFNYLDFIEGNNSESATKEKEPIYSEEFKRVYFDRLSEPYIYYPQIYDLITSSKSINHNDFISYIETSFEIKDGKINPAHELLNKFMFSGLWSFSDEEFTVKIKELLSYVENGSLSDLVSYLNAATYLFNLTEFLDISIQDLTLKITAGIDKFLGSSNLNEYQIDQYEMVSGNFKEENVKKIIELLKEKIEQFKKQKTEQEAIVLKTEFIKDLESFARRFRPTNELIYTPDEPFFHTYDRDTINDSIANWTPKGIMEFLSLLERRFIKSGFSDRLTIEISFLENLNGELQNRLTNSITLSLHLIKTRLIPTILHCKEKLNKLKAIQEIS